MAISLVNTVSIIQDSALLPLLPRMTPYFHLAESLKKATPDSVKAPKDMTAEEKKASEAEEEKAGDAKFVLDRQRLFEMTKITNNWAEKLVTSEKWDEPAKKTMENVQEKHDGTRLVRVVESFQKLAAEYWKPDTVTKKLVSSLPKAKAKASVDENEPLDANEQTLEQIKTCRKVLTDGMSMYDQKTVSFIAPVTLELKTLEETKKTLDDKMKKLEKDHEESMKKLAKDAAEKSLPLQTKFDALTGDLTPEQQQDKTALEKKIEEIDEDLKKASAAVVKTHDSDIATVTASWRIIDAFLVELQERDTKKQITDLQANRKVAIDVGETLVQQKKEEIEKLEKVVEAKKEAVDKAKKEDVDVKKATEELATAEKKLKDGQKALEHLQTSLETTKEKLKIDLLELEHTQEIYVDRKPSALFEETVALIRKLPGNDVEAFDAKVMEIRAWMLTHGCTEEQVARYVRLFGGDLDGSSCCCLCVLISSIVAVLLAIILVVCFCCCTKSASAEESDDL